VVLAERHGALVGWMRFTVRAEITLLAQGTWVDQFHRKLGIATLLWEAALQETRVAQVAASVVSERGMFLIRSLKARHPAVRFQVLT
jgi:GNAT superfamily N-acetyltransferase